MRARTKRLYAISIAACFVLAAGALVFVALGRHADLFYTPQKLAELGQPDSEQRIRVGGFVEPDSIEYGDGAEMKFTIIDGSGASVLVSFTGLAPDLFREGEGVVATGRFSPEGELFIAEDILAKHDENYQPRELEDLQYEKPAS